MNLGFIFNSFKRRFERSGDFVEGKIGYYLSLIAEAIMIRGANQCFFLQRKKGAEGDILTCHNTVSGVERPRTRRSRSSKGGDKVKIGRFELKRRENTVWDYVVPLSLVGLQILVITYAFTHYMIQNPYTGLLESVEKSIWDIKPTLILLVIYLFFIVLSTIYLTRSQRILTIFVMPFIAILLHIFDFIFLGFRIAYVERVITLFFFFPFFAAEYALGNLSLIFKFGEHPKNKENRKEPSLFSSAVAYGIYGLGIDILFLYTFNIQIGKAPAIYGFVFEKLLLPVPPSFPPYFFIFFVIGLVIEKYNQRKVEK